MLCAAFFNTSYELSSVSIIRLPGFPVLSQTTLSPLFSLIRKLSNYSKQSGDRSVEKNKLFSSRTWVVVWLYSSWSVVACGYLNLYDWNSKILELMRGQSILERQSSKRIAWFPSLLTWQDTCLIISAFATPCYLQIIRIHTFWPAVLPKGCIITRFVIFFTR